MFFDTTFRIGLNHISTNGIATNVGLLSILEEVAEMHSASVNLGLNDFPDTRINLGFNQLEIASI